MSTTQEQDVVAAKERAQALKDGYLGALSHFIEVSDRNKDRNKSEEQRALLAAQQKITAYFNFYEEFVGNSNLLGAHENTLWAQGFAEDCLAVLSIMPQTYEWLKKGFDDLELGLDPRPTGVAYANMQRMCIKYLKDELTKPVFQSFESSGLPVYGFCNKERFALSNSSRIIFAFTFGIVFILILLGVVLFNPNPSPFQQFVLRLIAALAAGGVVVMLPGFIELKLGKWLRAGGAVAVFVLVYKSSPSIIEQPEGQIPPAVERAAISTPKM